MEENFLLGVDLDALLSEKRQKPCFYWVCVLVVVLVLAWFKLVVQLDLELTPEPLDLEESETDFRRAIEFSQLALRKEENILRNDTSNKKLYTEQSTAENFYRPPYHNRIKNSQDLNSVSQSMVRGEQDEI